jgi:hypothetical protein
MGRRAIMAVKLRELGTRRFIGDTETMIVHDRWNENAEDCLMDVLIRNGTARGFEPDESDQAFWEDYEYCPNCFDRTDPKPPAWAQTGAAEETGEQTEEKATLSGAAVGRKQTNS